MPFANKEEQRAYHKAWYWKNRTGIKARVTKWNAANPERTKRYHDTCNRKKPWLILVQTAKGRAADKKVPFDLTIKWGEARWTGFCELTGLPFEDGIGKGKHGPYSASVDRIVPELGYVQNNCRIVLLAVNQMKSVGTDEQMYAIAEALLSKRR